MIYHVPMKILRWDGFEVFGQPASRPTPHCIGCLLVFDDEQVAREWAEYGDHPAGVVKIEEQEEQS